MFVNKQVNGILIFNNGFDGSELFFFKCKVIFLFNLTKRCLDLHFLLFVNITGNWKNRHAHTRQIIIADWLSLSESS